MSCRFFGFAHFRHLDYRVSFVVLDLQKIPRSEGGGKGGRERAFKGTSGPPPNYTTTHIHVLLMVSTLLNEISMRHECPFLMS